MANTITIYINNEPVILKRYYSTKTRGFYRTDDFNYRAVVFSELSGTLMELTHYDGTAPKGELKGNIEIKVYP